MEFALNVFIVLFGIVGCVAAMKVRHCLRSPGLLILAVALLYTTAARVVLALVTGMPTMHRSLIVFPNWPLVALGWLWLLYDARRLISSTGQRRREYEK